MKPTQLAKKKQAQIATEKEIRADLKSAFFDCDDETADLLMTLVEEIATTDTDTPNQSNNPNTLNYDR